MNIEMFVNKKSKNFLVLLFFFLFLFSFTSAGIYDEEGIYGEPINDTIIITYVNASNHTDIWDTNEGNMDNVPDLYPTLDTRFLLNTGDTATGNYTFDTDTFFIDSTRDRIGIGTIAPSYTFDLNGTFRKEYYSGVFYRDFIIGSGYELDGTAHASGGYKMYLRWGDGGYGGGGWDLIFGTPTYPALTIDEGSRVGIGTDDPRNQLHLNYTKAAGTTDKGNMQLQNRLVHSASNTLIYRIGSSILDGFSVDDYALASIDFNTSDNWYQGDMIFRTYDAPGAAVLPTERMIIKSDGDIGVGVLAPSEKFQINGSLFLHNDDDKLIFGAGKDVSIYYNGTQTFFNNDVGTGAFVFPTGRVGIGTTSPSYLLEVYANNTTDTQGVEIEQAGTGDSALNYLITGVTRWITGIDNSDGDKFKISSGSWTVDANTKFMIQTDGKVGIGTTTPQNLLNVVGDLNVTGTIFNDAIYCESSELADQDFPVAGTRYRLNISNVDEGNGITMSTGLNGTNITIDTSGVYHMVAQPQVKANAGGAGDFHMWLEKYTAGSSWTDIADSNIELKLSSLEEDVIVLATTLKLNQGEKLRLVASVSDNKILLHAQSPAGEPIIPSIIFTMYRVGS